MLLIVKRTAARQETDAEGVLQDCDQDNEQFENFKPGPKSSFEQQRIENVGERKKGKK